MSSALVIGGTGFVGRHAVENLLDHGYDVTAVSRGAGASRFADRPAVEPVAIDRTDDDALDRIAERVAPDVVVDCAAFYPDDVRTALDTFADVRAYVYVSSGAVYRAQELPKREDETPLHDCTPQQATDDSMATYGPRKAECDRLVTAAADRGIAAMTVRPTVVYGPRAVDGDSASDASPSWFDADLPINQTLHDYWVDRVNRYERLVVPGDGTAIWHRAYVEDVANALRIVAEAGEAGEAYNVGDRRVCTLREVVELIANTLDTSVELVYASRRELAQADLTPEEFILYHHPMTGDPHVLDTCKLASLGWQSTPVEEAMERIVEEVLTSGRDLSPHGPGRDAEERVLAAVG